MFVPDSPLSIVHSEHMSDMVYSLITLLTDAAASVSATDIPHHLEAMVELLCEEDSQKDTHEHGTMVGCYLLQMPGHILCFSNPFSLCPLLPGVTCVLKPSLLPLVQWNLLNTGHNGMSILSIVQSLSFLRRYIEMYGKYKGRGEQCVHCRESSECPLSEVPLLTLPLIYSFHPVYLFLLSPSPYSFSLLYPINSLFNSSPSPYSFSLLHPINSSPSLSMCICRGLAWSLCSDTEYWTLSTHLARMM